jgi:hypothetical protein
MKCSFIKSDGNKCKAFAMKNSNYCWIHSPEVSEQAKSSARLLGGINRQVQIPANLAEMAIKDTRDIPPLLVDTLFHIRRGEMDIRLGTAIGYLTNILMRSYELAEIENRMEKIEKFIDERCMKKI